MKIPIVLLICVVLAGCSLKSFMPAPKRAFTPQDLLVSQEDVPPSWTKTSGPKKVSDNQRSSDSAEITFSPTGNVQVMGFRESVFRYPSGWGSSNDYYDAITFPGETTIDGWNFESSTADEQKVSCYTYSNADIPVCRWVARYQEFVIEVVAWIGPSQVPIQEMEKLVRKINSKMSDFLK